MQRDNSRIGALEVTAGLHLGGRLALTDNCMMVVGSGTSCDLILGDEGVCERHCLIATHGDLIQVRALDGVVQLAEGGRIEPPGSVSIQVGRTLHLGEAAITLTDGSEPALAAGTTDDASSTNTETQHASRSTEAKHNVVPIPPMNIGSIVFLGAALTLTGFAYGMMGGGSDGVGASAPIERPAENRDNDDSRTKIEPTAALTDPETQGDAIANDVQEVLRLSGIRARTEYISDGEVRVLGHFGDGQRAREVIESRAMRAINGLERIVQVNLDQPSRPEQEPNRDQGPTVSVRRVVGGDDPFMVLNDGSRVYPGATFGDSARFRDVSFGRAVIEYDGERRRVDVVGRTLDEIADADGQPIESSETVHRGTGADAVAPVGKNLINEEEKDNVNRE